MQGACPVCERDVTLGFRVFIIQVLNRADHIIHSLLDLFIGEAGITSPLWHAYISIAVPDTTQRTTVQRFSSLGNAWRPSGVIGYGRSAGHPQQVTVPTGSHPSGSALHQLRIAESWHLYNTI